MSQLTLAVTVTQTPYATQPPAALFASIGYVITDNSGAELTGTLNGSETPPWSVTVTGADGPTPATYSLQAGDAQGNALGAPLTGTQGGTGGEVQTFPLPTAATLTVTG